MDFLNNAFTQVRDLFRSMTPGARITAGLLLVVVVISLAYLVVYQGSGSQEYLLGGEPFSPEQFQNMEAALGTAGLPYSIEGNRIRIPRGQRDKYMAALADANALPPQWGQAMDDVLKSESVFLSADQRRERYIHARGRDLSSIVSMMPGIQRASVIYQCETQPGFRTKTLNTGSVSVMPEPGQELRAERATAIRNLVAGAISGMKPEDVTVTDITNGRSFHGSLDGGDGNLGGAYAARKRQFEQDWKQKVLNMLSSIPGVTVEPNVVLSVETDVVTRTVTPNPKGTAVWTTEKSTDRQREGGGPAGQPGFKANQPNVLPVVAGRSSTDTESESESSERIMVGGTEEEKRLAGLTPTKVTVAIGVPSSYFERLWLEQNPAAPGEEQKRPEPNELAALQTQTIDTIRKLVANVLPPAADGVNSVDLVEVLSIPDLKHPEIPVPPMSETMLVWLGQYWSTLGMLGLAAFSLLMLRSMLRATAADVQPGKIKTAVISGDTPARETDQDEAPMVIPKPRLSRFSGNRASLGDELVELVREDADSAANILRSWIGTPSKKPS